MAGKLTPEEAKELGRKGGLASAAARADRAKMKSDVQAKNRFEQAADEMAELLLKAAKAQGRFKDISPDKQVAAILKSLEYGVGRPRQADPVSPEEKEEQAGLAFAVREEEKALDYLAGVEEPDDALREPEAT